MIQEALKVVKLYSNLYEVEDLKRFETFVEGRFDKAFCQLRHDLEKNLSPAADADMKYGTVSFYRFAFKRSWSEIFPHRVLTTSIDSSTEDIIAVIQNSKGLFKRLVLVVGKSILPQHLPKLMKLALHVNPKAIHLVLQNPSPEDVLKSINICSQISVPIHIEGNYDVDSFIHWIRTSRVNVHPYLALFSQFLQGILKIKATYETISIDLPPAMSWMIMNNYPVELCKVSVDFLKQISAEKLKEAVINYLEIVYKTNEIAKFIDELYEPAVFKEDFVVEDSKEYFVYSSLKEFYEDNKIFPFVLIEDFNLNSNYKLSVLRGKILCLRDLAILITPQTMEKKIEQISKHLEGLPISLVLCDSSFENVKNAMFFAQKYKFPLIITGLNKFSLEKITELADFYLFKKHKAICEVIPFSKAFQERCSQTIGITARCYPLESLFSYLGFNYKKEEELCLKSLENLSYIIEPIKKFEKNYCMIK